MAILAGSMQLLVDGLSKTYANGVRALDGVGFSATPGIYGLLGPNGAGKTTLMNTIATLQDPDSGTIRLGEIDVRRDKTALRRMLGYLPQEFGVYPHLSAHELLDYFAQLKGISDSAERRAHIAELLAMVNLIEDAGRAVDTFSGGMRQRFGIAQALIGRPRLIIVDEPTAGLDPAERARFHRILSDIAEGTVVILSTHIVEDVANLCSRLAVMNRGRVVAEGTPADLIDRLRRQLWAKPVTKSEAAELRQRHSIFSERLLPAGVQIVIRAASAPGSGFEPKEPDLEDVYFDAVPQVAA
jgi:ABC-type multidrug transport system ATPase subunit